LGLKDKVILICLFVSISLVVLSTGKGSWQDPLQVSGSVITGSWKEQEQIEPAGELEPGAPVEGLPDSAGLPGGEAEDLEAGESEDPGAGDNLDTSTPPASEDGSDDGGTGAEANDPGMGQDPAGVEDGVEPGEAGGGESEPFLTSAGQELIADDEGKTSQNAPDSTNTPDIEAGDTSAAGDTVIDDGTAATDTGGGADAALDAGAGVDNDGGEAVDSISGSSDSGSGSSADIGE
jgi:hypothetical protein